MFCANEQKGNVCEEVPIISTFKMEYNYYFCVTEINLCGSYYFSPCCINFLHSGSRFYLFWVYIHKQRKNNVYIAYLLFLKEFSTGLVWYGEQLETRKYMKKMHAIKVASTLIYLNAQKKQ